MKSKLNLKSKLNINKQGPQGQQKHSSIKTWECTMKSLEIKKWFPYQILGSKTVKNVQIDPQTAEIWPKQLNVKLSVSE